MSTHPPPPTVVPSSMHLKTSTVEQLGHRHHMSCTLTCYWNTVDRKGLRGRTPVQLGHAVSPTHPECHSPPVAVRTLKLVRRPPPPTSSPSTRASRSKNLIGSSLKLPTLPPVFRSSPGTCATVNDQTFITPKSTLLDPKITGLLATYLSIIMDHAFYFIGP